MLANLSRWDPQKHKLCEVLNTFSDCKTVLRFKTVDNCWCPGYSKDALGSQVYYKYTEKLSKVTEKLRGPRGWRNFFETRANSF